MGMKTRELIESEPELLVSACSLSLFSSCVCPNHIHWQNITVLQVRILDLFEMEEAQLTWPNRILYLGRSVTYWIYTFGEGTVL